MDSQLDLFAIPAPEAIQDYIVLGEGPYGMSWIESDAPISAGDNPLFFKCALCGKVTSSAKQEATHKPGCWHPYAEMNC